MTSARVVALIPAYSHIDWRLSRALRRVGLPFIEINGCSDLVRARSQLLADGLKTDAERFLFIDADMAPSADQIVALAESEKVTPTDAVTGLYRGRPSKLAVQCEEPFEPRGPRRFVPFLVAGMGFAAVHRETLETVRSTIPEVRDGDGNPWHPFFLPVVVNFEQDGQELHQYLPEDYSFWWRLRTGSEVNLWLDTHLCIGHVKQEILMP